MKITLSTAPVGSPNPAALDLAIQSEQMDDLFPAKA